MVRFVSAVARGATQKLNKSLCDRFEMKTSIIGTGASKVNEAKVLNRVMGRTDEVYILEADQRHVELVVDMIKHESESKIDATGRKRKTRGAASPGEAKTGSEEDEEELSKEEAIQFRSIAARVSYLAQDRPDTGFAVKEVCRSMVKPTTGAWKALERSARYLIYCLRMIFKYDWQGRKPEVTVCTDSDWAGCKEPGKSTSGGSIKRGSTLGLRQN